MNRRQDQQKTTEQEAMPKKGRHLKIPAEGISPPFTLESDFHKYLWVGRRESAHFGSNKLIGHNLIMGKMLNELSRIEIKHTFNAILPLPYYLG